MENNFCIYLLSKLSHCGMHIKKIFQPIVHCPWRRDKPFVWQTFSSAKGKKLPYVHKNTLSLKVNNQMVLTEKGNNKQTSKNTIQEKSVTIFCKIVLFVYSIGGQIDKIECAIKKRVALP